jgi:hypothetical protein
MSRFYGDLAGSAKTSATRRGTAASGVSAHVRGWNIGGRVEVEDDHGTDCVYFYFTYGTNARGSEQLVASFRLLPNGGVEKTFPKAP